ncbi:MAG TPA: hypothetical protein VE439_00840, partial [Anaerolineae bacterium]|nr:hypothetical protein [Anaerolineae bacterium]
MENKDNPHRQNGQRDEKIDGRAERLDDQDKQQRQEQEKGSKKSGYVAAIIINIVLLVIFNNLLNWHVPFLTGSFVIPLRILNISITATIIANLVFLAYDPAWFLALTRTV